MNPERTKVPMFTKERIAKLRSYENKSFYQGKLLPFMIEDENGTVYCDKCGNFANAVIVVHTEYGRIFNIPLCRVHVEKEFPLEAYGPYPKTIHFERADHIEGPPLPSERDEPAPEPASFADTFEEDLDHHITSLESALKMTRERRKTQAGLGMFEHQFKMTLNFLKELKQHHEKEHRIVHPAPTGD